MNTEKDDLVFALQELQTEIDEHVRKINQLKSAIQVKEQQLKQMPITLQRIIEECMLARNREIQLDLVENILDRVEVEFFPKLGSIEPPLYNDGWEDCLKELKGRLRE
jgi:molybdopterin converting factor small subunit